MVKIIITIIIIFIASTHSALTDCSRDELVIVAGAANNAYKQATGKLSLGFPNYGAYETANLLSEIKGFVINGGYAVEEAVKDELLALRKWNVFPLYELLATFPSSNVYQICKLVVDFARKSQEKPFMGGLMVNINESSTSGEMVEALKSFAQSWNVSIEKVFELSIEVNKSSIINTTSENFNINYLRALALGFEKLHNHIRGSNFLGGLIHVVDSFSLNQLNIKTMELVNRISEFDPELIQGILKDIHCLQLLANSQNFSNKELLNRIKRRLNSKL